MSMMGQRRPGQRPLQFKGSAGGHFTMDGRGGGMGVTPTPPRPGAIPMGPARSNPMPGPAGHFNMGGGGMSASANPGIEQSASAFDEGGPVDDPEAGPPAGEDTGAIPETPPDAGDAQQNTPEAQANDEDFNQKVKDAGHAIYEGVMSVPQYLNLLMGKDGMYDSVMNNSTVRAIMAATKSAMTPGPNEPPVADATDLQNKSFDGMPVRTGEETKAKFNVTGFGKAGKGLNEALNSGNEPPAPSGFTTMPGGMVSSGQQAVNGPAAPQMNPVATGAAFRQPGTQQQASNVSPAIQRLATMFQVDPTIVQQAHERFQSVGDYGHMLDYIAAHSNEAIKHQYEMEKTKTIYEGKGAVAAGHDASREQVATINGLFKNTNSQRQVMAQLQIAANRTGVASDGNIVRAVDAFRNANPGADLPPELQQSMADVLVRAHNQGQGGGGGDGGQGPIRVTPPGANPNANQQFAPPTMQMRGPDGNLHTFTQKNGQWVQQ